LGKREKKKVGLGGGGMGGTLQTGTLPFFKKTACPAIRERGGKIHGRRVRHSQMWSFPEMRVREKRGKRPICTGEGREERVHTNIMASCAQNRQSKNEKRKGRGGTPHRRRAFWAFDFFLGRNCLVKEGDHSKGGRNATRRSLCFPPVPLVPVGKGGKGKF